MFFGISHIKPREVPPNITKPQYVVEGGARTVGSSKPQYPRELKSRKVKLGSGAESRIREAAQLASRVRNFAGSLVRVGVTTDAIDNAVHDYIVSHSAYPSPLLYNDFPKSCCTRLSRVLLQTSIYSKSCSALITSYAMEYPMIARSKTEISLILTSRYT